MLYIKYIWLKRKNKYIKIGKIGKLTILLLWFFKTDFILLVLFRLDLIKFDLIVYLTKFLPSRCNNFKPKICSATIKISSPSPTHRYPNHINKCCNCNCSIGDQTIRPNTKNLSLNKCCCFYFPWVFCACWNLNKTKITNQKQLHKCACCVRYSLQQMLRNV